MKPLSQVNPGQTQQRGLAEMHEQQGLFQAKPMHPAEGTGKAVLKPSLDLEQMKYGV